MLKEKKKKQKPITDKEEKCTVYTARKVGSGGCPDVFKENTDELMRATEIQQLTESLIRKTICRS